MIQTSNELLLSNHETARAHQKSSEIKRKSPYPKPITYDPMTPPICPQHIASWPLPLIQGTSRHQLPWHSQGCTKPDSWTKGSKVERCLKISWGKGPGNSQETPRNSWWSYLLSRKTHPKPCFPCLYLPQASKRYFSKTIQKCSCFTCAFVQVFWAHNFCQSLGSVVPESN